MKKSKIILGLVLLASLVYGETFGNFIEKQEKVRQSLKEDALKNGKDLKEVADKMGPNPFSKALIGEESFEKAIARMQCQRWLVASLLGGCGDGSPFIASFEEFFKTHRNIDSESVTFQSFFDADSYNNQGKYYFMYGMLLQRINQDSMLVFNDATLSGRVQVVYVTGIPKNIDITKDTYILTHIKGNGSYNYTTTSGARQIIPKGIWVK